MWKEGEQKSKAPGTVKMMDVSGRGNENKNLCRLEKKKGGKLKAQVERRGSAGLSSTTQSASSA